MAKQIVIISYLLLTLYYVNGTSPIVNFTSTVIHGIVGTSVAVTAEVYSNFPTVTCITWTHGPTQLKLINNTKYVITKALPSISLTIMNAVEEDSTNYMLTVREAGNVVEVNFKLEIQVPPSFINEPADTTGIVDKTASLSCVCTGYPVPAINWFKDSAIIPMSNTITTSVSKVTSSVLVIDELDLNDAGSYYCNASNYLVTGISAVSRIAQVIVHYPPNVTLTPNIHLTVNVSDTVTLICSVFAIPLPVITWKNSNDGSIITGDSIRIFVTEMDSINVRVSTLNITRTFKFDESVYICEASNNVINELNTPESQSVHLIVQVPPNITALTPSPVHGVQGHNVNLSFSITDDDPKVNVSNIHWKIYGIHGNVDITDSPHYQLSSNRLMLLINQLTDTHGGIYTLYATNEAGTHSKSIKLIIESSPIMYIIPFDVATTENETVTFYCFATGQPLPNVSWYFMDRPVDFSSGRYSIGSSGRESGALTIHNVTFEDKGEYTCMYTNDHGKIESSAELLVQVHPVIVNFTVPANGTAGSDVIMTCDATGYPAPVVSWLFNGSLLMTSSLSEATLQSQDKTELYHVTSSIQLSYLTLSNAGLYLCSSSTYLKIMQEQKSDQHLLNVLYPPYVSISLGNVTVNQTDDVALNCTVFSTPLSTIEWHFNGSHIAEELISEVTTLNESGILKQISTLAIPHVVKDLNEGGYTCNATNGIANLIGSKESHTIVLTVQVPPTVFSSYSKKIGVVTHSVTIEFTVIDASPPVLVHNIQWMLNDSIISNNSHYVFSADHLSLTVINLQHFDEGYYTVLVANEAGVNKSTVFLEVNAPPVILTPPHNITQLEGYNVTFTCNATAKPIHTVKWFLNDVPLSNHDSNIHVSSDDTSYGELTIFDVQHNDSGQYACLVSNGFGNDTASAYLTVQVVPQFTLEPTNHTKLFGDNVTMSCTAYGVPTPKISWLKDGLPIDVSSSTVTVYDSNIIANRYMSSSILLLISLNFSDVADYSCTAVNHLYSTQTSNSTTALLIIHKPSIIIKSPDNTTVNETDTVSFKCIAEGLPTPTIVWSIQDHAIDINTTITQRTLGPSVTQSVLTFNAIKDTDAMQYTCTASNIPAGNIVNVSSSFTVTVQTQPVVQFIIENDTVIGVEFQNGLLTINVTRDLPKVKLDDIQWYFDRQGESYLLTSDGHYIISNDRLSLTLVNLRLNDTGNYTVEASNFVGTGFATIKFEVQKAPVVITPFNSLTLLAGTDATLACTATAIPKHTISWLKDSTELMNSTKHTISELGTATSTLIINSIDITDRGNYTCVAENIHGNDSFTDQLYVQVPPSFIVFPEPLTLIASDTVVITCIVTGYPQPSVDILKDDMLINFDGTRSQGSFSDGTQFSSISITLYSLTYNDSANYSCNATNYLASVETRTSSSVPFLVQYPPDVTVTPATIVVNETDQVTFLCEVFGIPPPDIIWINDFNDELTDSINNGMVISYSSTPHPSGILLTISNLTILNVTKEVESNYTCIASNEIINLIGTPENETVSIFVQVPPAVRYDDDILIGVVNDSIVLSFLIERASPPVYIEDTIWTFIGFNNIPQVIKISSKRRKVIFDSPQINLTLSDLKLEDEGLYILNARNPAGTGSAAINLTVEAAPIFLNKPRHVSTVEGMNAVFNCSGFAKPVHSMCWEKNGMAIAQFLSTSDRENNVISFAHDCLNTNIRGKSITVNDSKYSLKGDENGLLYGQLTIFDVDRHDIDNYTCVIANTYNTLLAQTYLLVQVIPVFISLPDPVMNFSAAENVTFTCNASGLPEPNINWYFNGKVLTDEQEGHQVDVVYAGLTVSHFSLQLSLENQGYYWCNASNYQFQHFEVMSSQWRVNVHYPANVIDGPQSSVKKNAQYVQFTCKMSGLPQPYIQWNKSGEKLSSKTGKIIIKEQEPYIEKGLVIVSSSLLITNLSQSDQSVYTCIGIDSLSIKNYINATREASANLTVLLYPHIAQVANSEQIVLLNTSHTLSFTVTMSQPAPLITWEFSSFGITSPIFSSNRYIFSNDRHDLTILNVRVEDGGTYRFIASNVAGTSSREILLIVNGPPFIMEKNQSTVISQLGDTVLFNCTSNGVPQPKLSWFLNEISLVPSPRWFISNAERSDQSVFSQLALTNVERFDHKSLIICKANNDVGDPVTLVYTLVVEGVVDFCSSSPCMNGGTCYSNIDQCVCPNLYTGSFCEDLVSTDGPYISPSIVLPPQPVETLLLSTVNLTCVVQGNPVPVIRWYKDDSEINGERSSTYYIPELTIEKRGMYHCSATSYFNTVPQIVLSIPVFVNIKNLAQYYVIIKERSTDTAPMDSVNYNDFVGILFYNESARIYSIQNTNKSLLVNVELIKVSASTLLQEELFKILNSTNVITVINLARFDGCRSEAADEFEWPETNIGDTVIFNCPCGRLSLGTEHPVATRFCDGDFNIGAEWMTVNTTQCEFGTTVQALCNISQMSMVDEVSNDLMNLVCNYTDRLSPLEILVSVSLLESFILSSIPINNITYSFIGTTECILNSKSLYETHQLYNTSARLILALDNFTLLLSTKQNNSLFILYPMEYTKDSFNETCLNISELMISLPVDISDLNFTKIAYTYYFHNNITSLLFHSKSMTLLSGVILINIGGLVLSNISTPISVTFFSITETESEVYCVLWDFTGEGEWSTESCATSVLISNIIKCQCNSIGPLALAKYSLINTTNITVVDTVDVIMVLSVVGMSISIVCIVITLITYMHLSWKNSDVQLLSTNIFLPHLLVYAAYIGITYSDRNNTTCIVFAALLHYAILVTLFSILGQAVYFIIINWKTKYSVATFIISFGFPLLVVAALIPLFSYHNHKLCHLDILVLSLALIVPFVSIICIVLLLFIGIFWKKEKVLVTSVRKSYCLRFFIHYILFVVSWTIELSILLEYNIHIALRVVNLILGSLLGLYLLLIYCVSSSGARTAWKKLYNQIACHNYDDEFIFNPNDFQMIYKPPKPVLELKQLHYGVPGYWPPPEDESSLVIANSFAEPDISNSSNIKRVNSNVSVTKV